MRRPISFFFSTLLLAPSLFAQNIGLQAPESIAAGDSFSIQTTGSGNATLYIVGPNQVLKRDAQLGRSLSFPSGTLHNAGHYLVILKTDSSSSKAELDVLPAATPSELSFSPGPPDFPSAFTTA